MLFELRNYSVADGRMEEEFARARACIFSQSEGGLGLFERHGIPRPVGIWRAVTGPRLPLATFIYPWESAAQRWKAFTSFSNDPDWLRERDRTNGRGQIVENMDNLLLVGDPIHTVPGEGIHEFCRIAPGDRFERAVGPLRPLCGSDLRDLYLRIHSDVELLNEASRTDTRVLFTPVDLRSLP